MSDLPQKWMRVTLHDVGEIITGKTPPTKQSINYGGDIPFVKPGDLNNSSPITNTEQTLSEIGAKHVRILRPGAVLVSCIGNLGKIGIAGVPLATNQQINAIEFFSSIVDDRYAYHYCKTLKPWMQIEASATTVTILNKGKFSNAQFIIAPINEQKRIADKLDRLLARVDACCEHLDRVPEILKRFRQAVLAEAVSGRLTEELRDFQLQEETIIIDDILQARRIACELYEVNRQAVKNFSKDNNRSRKYKDPEGPDYSLIINMPKSWTLVSTDQISSLITDGKHGDCKDEPNSGFYFISVKDLYKGNLHYENARQITEQDFLDVHYRTFLEMGDILITNAGTIGRVAIAKDKEKVSRTTFQKSVAILKPLRDFILPEYLAMYIENIVTELQEKSSGTAVKNLLLRDLRKINIALPPLKEQKEIVRRVENLLSHINKIEDQFLTTSILVDKLTPSLLAKAFRGELVPQNFEDEPAKELLERIRVEKEESEKLIEKYPKTTEKNKHSKTEVSMKKLTEIKTTHLSDILRETGSMLAENLWASSGLEIDDFYRQLKEEEMRGLLKEIRNPLNDICSVLEECDEN